MTGPASRIDSRQKQLLHELNCGAWRSPIYLELILRDIERMPRPVTALEIGCGRGFDGDIRLQREMSAYVDRFVGIEPDHAVDPQPIFANVVRSLLEDAELEPGSVDVAYSVMVMEHVAQPTAFMTALARVLRPGGIYWGFTVDRRHWFATVANTMSKLRLKSLYLSALYGRARGQGRYLDYPTEYKLNAPGQIYRLSQSFSQVDTWNVGPINSASSYAPSALRRAIDHFEGHRIRCGRPRTDLVVRLVK
jgi:SAM-dependent methyltransferase